MDHGPLLEEPPEYYGEDMEGSEADVFGHGGSLSQPEEGEADGADADAAGEADTGRHEPGVSEDQGPSSEKTKVWRCTIIREVMGTEPTRRRVEIWIDTDDRQIKCRGDEAHTEVIQGVGDHGMGRRRGAHAVAIPEHGTRLVFCGTREAEEFLGDWARLATGSGRARGADADADARDGDDDASAVARWRAARARERVENLRARVIARVSEGAEAGRAPLIGTQPEQGAGEEQMRPAPATPEMGPRGDRAVLNLAREYGTGCECRGRTHEACARRVRPRIKDDAKVGTGTPRDEERGDQHAQSLGMEPRANPPPAQSGDTAGEEDGQVSSGLRAVHEPRDHHRLHHHHHGEEGAKGNDDGRWRSDESQYG